MNPADLPFDTEAMLKGLRPWIERESPTWDAGAVNAMLDLAAYDLACMGAEVDFIPGRMGLGGSLRARLPHPRRGEPGILISGHMDTVHPVGTLNKNPWRREGDKCFGPGIQDMKSGNYLALEAWRQLTRAGVETPLPVTVLFTPDEEIGTPSTRELIEGEAARNLAVLVPEPARGDGGLTNGRYAIARFNLVAHGRPSHAGARLSEGKSAIREMARRILEIEQMTTEDCTFSVGVIHAGQWVNCVASSCDAEALSMAKKQADLDAGVARMEALTTNDFTVTRGVTRPVWEPSARDNALFEKAAGIAKGLGFEVTAASSPGGSDGNFTGAMGIPTLDSLGARGDGLHTLGEHIFVDSLAERGRLFAGLLATIDGNEGK